MTPKTPTKYPRATRPRNTTPKPSAGELVVLGKINAVVLSVSRQTKLARIVTESGEVKYVPFFRLKSKAIPNRGKVMDCLNCRKLSYFVVNSRNYKCAVCKSHQFCAGQRPIKELLRCCNTKKYISYRLKCTNCGCLTEPLASKRQMDNYIEKLREVRCAEALVELSRHPADSHVNITRKYLSDQENRIRSIIERT